VAVGLGVLEGLVLAGLVLVDRVVGVTVAGLFDGPDLLEDEVVLALLPPEELESWYRSSNFPAPQYSEGFPGQAKLQLA
jgi:hypothetical protein